MKTDNIIQIKSYAFAVKIIKIYKHLCDDKKEFVLSKLLLRCGTSIGANIEEAIGGQSDKDFYAKLTISYKEARETHYWIRLLKDTNYLSKEESNDLLKTLRNYLEYLAQSKKNFVIPNS
jgi:four helix bundle protein